LTLLEEAKLLFNMIKKQHAKLVMVINVNQEPHLLDVLPVVDQEQLFIGKIP
jgi:hypothetical protein